jgi:outer membrane immunogenic protein
VQTDWLFTLRGRLGWATPTWLLYVTGGLAVTGLKVGGTFAAPIPFDATANISRTEDKLGFAVGAGAEWALSRNWSLKAEYLFVDFGMVTASGFATGSGIVFGNPFAASQAISTSADLVAHMARVGINYRF